MTQTTNNILVVRPASFGFNQETAGSNSFQKELNVNADEIRIKKLNEFESFVEKLKASGVNVCVFDDTTSPEKPDAIFPNNWISFHTDGTVIIYPMFAENRRQEKRLDFIEKLKKHFIITNIVDLSDYEQEGKYLEGTGSIIFDHISKVAYACISPRTNLELYFKVCTFLNYKAVYFYAHDKSGKEIYHTNVMMCIAEKFAVICMESITNNEERQLVLDSLTSSGHQVIDISFQQMENFAGNMLSLHTLDNSNILALSQSSFDSLRTDQIENIEKYCKPIPLNIKTIETIGGGSARCMIAEIFLQPKNS